MAENKSTRVYTASTDLTGEPFGRWIVLNEAPARKGRRYWNCRCECGSESIVDGKELRLERSRGCGRCRNLKHGYSTEQSSEYMTWKNIKSRCNNPNNKSYNRYGERSIRVCDRWMESFEAFLADMGMKPFPEATIERIDNDGPYSKENCKWATQSEQMRNMSRNRLITFQGRTQCLQDWVNETGLSKAVISNRLKKGWTVEETLTVPSIQGRRQDNVFLTFDGETFTVAEWARKTGINVVTLYWRLKKKWTVERALTTPAKQLAKKN